jgi:hypothetical protein
MDMASKRKWIAFSIIIGCVFLFFGWFLKQRAPGARCDYDGVNIQPLNEVSFILQDCSEKKFCSMICALRAVAQYNEKIKSILVTDEITGRKVKAEKAFFVESSVLTFPYVRNNVHVFASEESAQRHQNQYKGKSIPNPFSSLDLWREEMVGAQKVRIKIDSLSGLPRIIRGFPSVMVLKDSDPKNLNEQGAWKILTTLLSLFKHYLDLDVQEFKLIDMKCVENTWYISFWQTYGGVIIYESSMGFCIGPRGDIPSIGMILHKAHKKLHLSTQAKLSLKEATIIAMAYLKKSEPWEHKLRAYQLIIYPMKKEGRVDYYLAYILNLYSPEDRVVGSSRVGWACFIDAVTGQLVDAHRLLAIPNCCEVITEEDEK